MIMHKDALNNPIVIGNTYGYAKTDTVCIGKAISVTDHNVILEVIDRRWYLYGNESDHSWRKDSAKVKVPAYQLFPVQDYVKQHP